MNLSINDLKDWDITENDGKKYLPWINSYSKEFNVNTPNRIIALWMNILHESGNFKYVKEILPKNNPSYVKRLGNYFGRGLLQVTHLDNYKQLTTWVNKRGVNIDFVKNPELLETPEYAVLSAFWYWDSRNLNKLADEGNFEAVSSVINTGRENGRKINGLNDRLQKQKKIEKWLMSIIA